MVDSRDKMAQIYSELAELRERLDKENEMTVSYTPKGLVMRLTDHALFDVGAAAISPEAIPGKYFSFCSGLARRSIG